MQDRLTGCSTGTQTTTPGIRTSKGSGEQECTLQSSTAARVIGGRERTKKRPQYYNRSEEDEHRAVVDKLRNDNFEIFEQESLYPQNLPKRPKFCMETRHRKSSFLRAVNSRKFIPLLHPMKSASTDQNWYIFGKVKKTKLSEEVILQVTIIQIQPTRTGYKRHYETWWLSQMPDPRKQTKEPGLKLIYGTKWLNREAPTFDWRHSGAILVVTAKHESQDIEHSLVVAFDQNQKLKKQVRNHHCKTNLLSTYNCTNCTMYCCHCHIFLYCHFQRSRLISV